MQDHVENQVNQELQAREENKVHLAGMEVLVLEEKQVLQVHLASQDHLDLKAKQDPKDLRDLEVMLDQEGNQEQMVLQGQEEKEVNRDQ